MKKLFSKKTVHSIALICALSAISTTAFADSTSSLDETQFSENQIESNAISPFAAMSIPWTISTTVIGKSPSSISSTYFVSTYVGSTRFSGTLNYSSHQPEYIISGPNGTEYVYKVYYSGLLWGHS